MELKARLATAMTLAAPERASLLVIWKVSRTSNLVAVECFVDQDKVCIARRETQ